MVSLMPLPLFLFYRARYLLFLTARYHGLLSWRAQPKLLMLMTNIRESRNKYKYIEYKYMELQIGLCAKKSFGNNLAISTSISTPMDDISNVQIGQCSDKHSEVALVENSYSLFVTTYKALDSTSVTISNSSKILWPCGDQLNLRRTTTRTKTIRGGSD